MPQRAATCAELLDVTAGVAPVEGRIDFSLKGVVSSVRSDGVLWYITVCRPPELVVMCVTYSGNGMKPGESVLLRGGYSRLDERHAVLDPCLASREE